MRIEYRQCLFGPRFRSALEPNLDAARMAEPGNGLNHVTAIREELEVLVIIANRWVTEFLVVQLRRASSGDFKVRFGEVHSLLPQCCRDCDHMTTGPRTTV